MHTLAIHDRHGRSSSIPYGVDFGKLKMKTGGEVQPASKIMARR